jgi:uncharacterized protein YjfI (DUF2170 family)
VQNGLDIVFDALLKCMLFHAFTQIKMVVHRLQLDPLFLLLSNTKIIPLSNLSSLSVPGECYSSKASCALNLESTFLLELSVQSDLCLILQTDFNVVVKRKFKQ